MVIKTSEFQNVGTLYWVSHGRMVKVTAIASGVQSANHFYHDNERATVLNQTPEWEVILIADENDRGIPIRF